MHITNPRWLMAAILNKIEKSPYLSTCLTDRHEIWQSGVHWPSEPYQQLTVTLSPTLNYTPPAMRPFVKILWPLIIIVLLLLWDEARPLVRVSALCFLQCFDGNGCVAEKTSGPQKSVPIIHRGSLLEQVKKGVPNGNQLIQIYLETTVKWR